MKPNLPLQFSQSSLQDYADCPRRFQLRHLRGMAWPSGEAEPATVWENRKQEGLLFHRLVHRLLLGLPPELMTGAAHSENLTRWWRNHLSADFGLSGCTLRSEIALSCPVGEHRLVAKYDLIATRDRQAIIFDWKTYAQRPPDQWLSSRWQTTVYRALLVRAGAVLNAGSAFLPEAIKMIYWFADFPAEPASFDYTTSQYRADWAEIERLVSEIPSARNFPLTEDHKMCRFCVYRSYCDRGHRAAPWEEGETELAPGDSYDAVAESEESFP